MAWKGPDCTEPVDFCMSSPCENGGECQSNESGYHCTCANGWTGSQCETNVDECLEEPCFNNGTCVDTDGSFQCLCINGTLGKCFQDGIQYWFPGRCLKGHIFVNQVSPFPMQDLHVYGDVCN